MTTTTAKLLKELEDLYDDDTTAADSEPVPEPDPIILANYTSCRLINMHMRKYFDDIYVTYRMFRDGEWDVSKVLYQNEDILFYSKRFVPNQDRSLFDPVFTKYVSMLENIFDQRNMLMAYLRMWTDMSKPRWKANNKKSYLLNLINGKYRIIDPSYTVTVFHDNRLQYAARPGSSKKTIARSMALIQTKTEEHLNQIMSNVNRILRVFNRNYKRLVNTYVYGHSSKETTRELYLKALLNCTSLSIFEVADKLIDQHIHAVHPLINDIIEYYTPIDDLLTYNPADHGGKPLLIL